MKKGTKLSKSSKAKKSAGATKRGTPKAAAKKRAAPAKKSAVSAKKAATPKRMALRADLGAPVEGFFDKQPLHIRPILDELRAMISEVLPNASSSLKWGMPFYELAGEIVCALAGFKGHVNLILPGPPGTYADPGGLLEGEGKTGRHLKVRSLDELPRDAVRAWLVTARERAQKQS